MTAISPELHQQKRDIVKELKGVLERCGTDDGLPKDEMERERVRLELFMEKSNGCIDAQVKDNVELIEDLN